MSFEASEEQDEVMSEINMTPLVDIMLVLLIIFMITIPVVQHAVKVELPRASSSRDKTPPENLQLAVDAQGQFFLGKQEIAADAKIDTPAPCSVERPRRFRSAAPFHERRQINLDARSANRRI